MNKTVFNKSVMFILASLFIFSGAVFAQDRMVTGKVTDGVTGEELPGVTIHKKNTSEGTITMLSGDFTISAKAGDILVFSFIGFKAQEVVVLNQSSINVKLESSVVDMEEVIIIGYGVQKKEDKTGAVAQITAAELNGGALTDPIQALQGKTAGVSVTKSGGDPNGGFSVKIRGAAGFDSDTQPLYVVDGVRGVDPTTISQDDIATFNILKDAASTAIYGSQGSNGVVIITTKRGNKDASSISVNSSLSVDNVANRLDLLSASDMRDYYSNTGQTVLDGGGTTDWQDEIFRTGITQQHNINFSGGSEKSTYYASISNSSWDGIMKGSSKERTIGKINLTHKGFDDKLTVSASLSGTLEENDYENFDGFDKDDIIYQAYSRNPTDPLKNADGSYYQTDREFNYENPMSVINNIDNYREAKRYFSSLKADYEITKGLTASINLGYTKDDHVSTVFRPTDVYSQVSDGFGSKRYESSSQQLLETTLNYVKTYNGSHNLNSIVGYSWQQNDFDGFFAEGRNPASPSLGADKLEGMQQVSYGDIGSWRGMSRLIGYFGRVQYNYNHKYYASASIRTDGSTKFGTNSQWGVFPTVAMGWTISQEDFLKDSDWLNNLKLRASYGVSGNQNIGEYKSQVLYKTDGLVTNPETGLPVLSFRPSWNSNPDLQWEETTETNIGVDFGLLNNKIAGSLELYYKKTTDLLGEYQVPVPPNLSNTTFANSGELENKGIEFNVQYFAVDTRNFKWKTTFNVSHNQQVMLSLGEYAPEDGIRKEGFLSGRGLIGNNNYITGVIEGEPLGSFYLPEYRGLNEEGKFLYTSVTGGVTSELSSAKRYIAGSPLPDVEFGWSNSLTIMKNWNLDFSFRSMVGNEIYNATRMFFDDPAMLNNLNAIPESLDWYALGRKSSPSVMDTYVEDASFLRLDYLSLGYNFKFSNDKMFKQLKLYVTGNNLLTLTNYSGVDPETKMDGVSFGVDQYNVYPKTRSFTFGIKATL